MVGKLFRGAMLLLAVTFATAGAARADNTNEGGVEFAFAGSGSSDKDFDGTQLSFDGSVGVFLNPMVEIGLRQSATYATSNNADDFWSATTRGFLDLQFNLGRFAPFVGANIGYVYGDVNDTFAAAPEAGVKLYLGDSADTFIFGRVEYQFFFDDAEEADDSFDDGQFIYSIGVGVRL